MKIRPHEAQVIRNSTKGRTSFWEGCCVIKGTSIYPVSFTGSEHHLGSKSFESPGDPNIVQRSGNWVKKRLLFLRDTSRQEDRNIIGRDWVTKRGSVQSKLYCLAQGKPWSLIRIRYLVSAHIFGAYCIHQPLLIPKLCDISAAWSLLFLNAVLLSPSLQQLP